MGYNDKLSNDGYISLIFKNKWVGGVYLSTANKGFYGDGFYVKSCRPFLPK